MPISADIGIVFLLVLSNGFFAMSELAIVSVRKARLKQLADEGKKGATLALRMAENPGSFLSIVQAGMTLNSVLAGAFGGTTLAAPLAKYLNSFEFISPHGETLAFSVTVALVTYFSLVIGELMPKRVGLAFAEPIAVRVALLTTLLAQITAPVVWLLNGSTELMLRLLGFGDAKASPVTEEEVKHLIAEGAETGAIKPEEKTMLDRVMRLADRTVRTIMTPRLDMVWLGSEDLAAENKEVIRSSGYSRFPVAKGDLEQIVGIVHAKDMLHAHFDGKEIPALKAIMRAPLIVPDTTPVLRLLDQFKTSGQHIATVVDEYGSVEGLVSVTDILEAVTGELPERGREGDDKAYRREDGGWVIGGMTPIDEVERLLGLRQMLGDGDFHTIAGFIIYKLGRIPVAGDHFEWEGARFEVLDMDSRRVDKVVVHPPVVEEPEPEAGG